MSDSLEVSEKVSERLFHTSALWRRPTCKRVNDFVFRFKRRSGIGRGRMSWSSTLARSYLNGACVFALRAVLAKSRRSDSRRIAMSSRCTDEDLRHIRRKTLRPRRDRGRGA